MEKVQKKWFFVALGAGILVFVLAKALRPSPPVLPAAQNQRLVDVYLLDQQAVRPKIEAFGRIMPKTVWNAVAEVEGKVIFRHPQLEKGQVLEKDTVIARLDPTSFGLTLSAANADLAVATANLEKLFLEQKNLTASLSLENDRLKLNQSEFKRKKNLQQKGLTSRSELDTEQQALLAQQSRVRDLQNRLAVLPKEIAVAEAQKIASETRLQQAERDLQKTVVTLPIRARIAQVDLVEDQFVPKNSAMVTAYALDEVEIDVQVPVHDVYTLLGSLTPILSSSLDYSELMANIFVSSGQFEGQWPAKIVRVSNSADTTQATLTVTLSVSHQAQGTQAIPLSLLNGLYAKAEIHGPRQKHWVLPEYALRGNTIYAIENNKLKKTPVKVLHRQDNHAFVIGDFEAQQAIILNDLLPAVEGMSVKANSVNAYEAQNDESRQESGL